MVPLFHFFHIPHLFFSFFSTKGLEGSIMDFELFFFLFANFFNSLRPPILCHFKPILRIVIVLNSTIDFGLCVHHKGSMLHHRFVQRLPSDQHEPQRLRRFVPNTNTISRTQDYNMVCWNRWRVWYAKNTFTFNYVHKGIPWFRNALVHVGFGFESEIKVHCRSSGVNRWPNTHWLSCYDSDFNPIFLCPWYFLT